MIMTILLLLSELSQFFAKQNKKTYERKGKQDYHI